MGDWTRRLVGFGGIVRFLQGCIGILRAEYQADETMCIARAYKISKIQYY